MKKVLAVVLCLTLVMVLFAGCGSNSESAATSSSAAASSAAPSSAAASSSAASSAADGAVKTGLAVLTSVAKSTDAGEKDGLAQADSTIVAVTVDKDGKIVKCVIDAAQTKVNFSKEGKLLTDLKSEFKTKDELGEGYGMKKASKIGKEWSEQAAAFANYVVGKTVDEVKGIAVDDKGAATDKELLSSVTVHITDFTAAIEKAVASAQDLGAKASDKLGLGVTTNITKSTDAGDKDGLAQVYSTYTVSTFGADGKITSSIIDASQANINFSKAGKITSDIKAAVQTKNEIGAGYGMKKASKIGKEWNEEAAAFAKYVTGKTVDEVKGIAVKEGVPSDTELASSVTIHIGDFQNIIEKASKTAK